MKYAIYSVVALIIVIIFSYLLVRFLTKKKNVSKGKKTLLTALMSVLLIVISSLGYLLPYSKSEAITKQYLASVGSVSYEETGKWISYKNPDSDKAFIFYPGAKVDSHAYAQLAREIAEEGIDTCIVKFPFHMAFFKMNAAAGVLKDKEYKEIYLGGHSLGGVAACSYSLKNEEIDGVILLASYPTEKINCKLLSIYGDRDGCLEKNVYEDAKQYWSEESTEVIIKGGNHANFAQYGKQKGDNEATITAEEQISQTSEAIISFIKGSSK